MEINEDKYTIVFPKEYLKTAQKTANMLDRYIPLYNKYYNYELNEKILFFIDKPNKQKSNGFALFNKIHIYSGSNSVLEYDLSTTSEWGKLLVIHELAHSYQTISTKYLLKRKILRYDISTFLEPNLFIPLAFIEGNAVLMESLFHNGGRIYSGYSKALLNSMIYDDKLSSNAMLLSTRNFPYADVKYLVGGFFMKYLYDRYGLDMVNSYFINHSDFYLLPFSLGFSNHFKDSFENIFNDFKKLYKSNNFIKSKGELIAKSSFTIDLNKQNNEIYFLTTIVHNESDLNIFDIKTNKIQKRKSIFLNTRAFKIDNKFYFIGNANIDNDNFYGLYDEEFNRLENSKSKIFTNISSKDKYYFDSVNSFDKLRLYKNNDFIDEVDSSNIVDDDGDLYYFKNINEKRWLIKNNKTLFSLIGRYAFVVDRDEKFIYFISSSSNGSSLFAWDKINKEVIRVFKSDDIYNAKKIDDDYFLISIITSSSHQLLKAKGLFFKEEVIEVIESSIYTNKIKPKNTNFKIAPYNPYSSMSINSISFSFYGQKDISFEASDISDNVQLNGYLSKYRNSYLNTLKYENNYYDDFHHKALITISGQFEMLLFRFLYDKSIYRQGNKYLSLALGYEYLDKREDRNSLSLSLAYSKKISNILDSFPLRGYYVKLYLNHIISDGVNIKSQSSFYKKIYKNLFLNANVQSAFSTSKAYKNKISIEGNDIENEHIKADNYAGSTFNDWIVKTNIKIDYEKYLGFYSKYYLSLVKSNVFIESSNFQFENDSFNENIFGIKSTFLIGHNDEVDFIVKKIYNGIYGNKYEFKISVDL